MRRFEKLDMAEMFLRAFGFTRNLLPASHLKRHEVAADWIAQELLNHL